MKIRLLTKDELRECMFASDAPQEVGPLETKLCTISDLFDLAELVRKSKDGKLPGEFKAATRELLRMGDVCIESLDADRLHRNMFDDCYGRRPGLWPPARDPSVSIGKTLRRLILRISDTSWWDDEVYEEMDQRPCPKR